MKSKKGPRTPARPFQPASSRARSWQIILLDQAPLRHAAASACQREMARLDKAKAEWKRFESEDKTAFERWSAATFGPLLSSIRDVEGALRAKEMLLHEVEMEMMFGGASSPRSAYRRVMKRRNAPPPPMDGGFDTGWGDDGPSPGAESADGFPEPSFNDLDEIEQELLFEEFLSGVLGMNPDRMSDAKYFRMFDEFKQTLLDAEKGSPPPRPDADFGRRPEPAPAPTSESARVKELYRLLVRRLHPDMRAGSSAEVSALWHEVQEAYSAGNIERLEMLLALTDIQSNEAGDHTSLSQMRSVLAELIRSFRALQKNLRGAKKERAWNFSRLPADGRSSLERKMRFEFQAKLQSDQCELKQIEIMIASWADRPKAKTPTANQRGKKRISVIQSDLPF